MTKIKVKTNKLPEEIMAELKHRLNTKFASSVLVKNAKRTIKQKGPKGNKYAELWATRTKIGYRKGGKPLWDTGHMIGLLDSKSSSTVRGIKWTLLDGTGYGVKHQEGFINTGPIVIPLSRAIARLVAWLGESPHDKTILPAHLREAPNATEAQKGDKKYDYYMLPEGEYTVPARPIATATIDDVKAIHRKIKLIIKGLS